MNSASEPVFRDERCGTIPGMPSGRVHNIINTATYSLIAAAAVWGSQQQLVVITPAQGLAFSAAYAAGTFLLSPDLDLAEGRVDSKRRWGWLGFVWVPYGRMFSHRGLSHTWLLGPLTRLIYLGVLLLLVWALLSAVWPAVRWPPARPLSIQPELAAAAGAGLLRQPVAAPDRRRRAPRPRHAPQSAEIQATARQGAAVARPEVRSLAVVPGG